jgi:cytochrome c oxidase cbb3-type subunit 1
MMSIKTVNALSHYTDWTIGHVHSGALGWVAMITIGSIYSLLPRVYGRAGMHSTRLIDLHFWITTVGVVIYIASMWMLYNVHHTIARRSAQIDVPVPQPA